MTHSPLQSRLRRTGRRLLLLGGTAAVTWGLIAAALMTLAGAWLDLLWELSPQARFAALGLAAAASVLLVAALVRGLPWLPAMRPSPGGSTALPAAAAIS